MKHCFNKIDGWCVSVCVWLVRFVAAGHVCCTGCGGRSLSQSVCQRGSHSVTGDPNCRLPSILTYFLTPKATMLPPPPPTPQPLNPLIYPLRK